MTQPEERICTGVDWSEPDRPLIRFAPVSSRVSSRERSELVSTEVAWRFRVVDTDVRYCCGWFELVGDQAQHRPCPANNPATEGRQCARCRNQGFGLHLAHRGGDQTASVRDYLAQPHRLYLAVFADGTIKVGTAAQSRLDSRIAEQGAVAACFVASAANGVDVRLAEDAVSARFGLTQSVSARRKLRACGVAVDVDRLTAGLHQAIEDILPYLAVLASEHGWVEPARPPIPWRLPDHARRLFAATPLVAYPNELDRGDHSLYVRAMSGPIAMVTMTAEPDAQPYAVNLTEVFGVPMRFGEFRSTPRAVQASLF